MHDSTHECCLVFKILWFWTLRVVLVRWTSYINLVLYMSQRLKLHLWNESSRFQLCNRAPDNLLLYLLDTFIVLQPQDLHLEVACVRTTSDRNDLKNFQQTNLYWVVSRLGLCKLVSICFLPRDAMPARVIAIATCLSVCPSVCPSRAGIVSKRRKL